MPQDARLSLARAGHAWLPAHRSRRWALQAPAAPGSGGEGLCHECPLTSEKQTSATRPQLRCPGSLQIPKHKMQKPGSRVRLFFPIVSF